MRASTPSAALIALAVGGTWGCAPAKSSAPKDRGSWEDERAPPPAPVPKVFGPWERFDEVSSFLAVGEPMASEHAGGGLFGQVLVDQGAAGYGQKGRASPMPPGATVALALRALGEENPRVYFVMAKQPPGYDAPGNDWEYLVVLPTGRVEDRGRLALCARCHAEGPREHLFESWR